MKTIAVGHTTLDRYGDDLLPGGSAWYGARVLHALGARSTLVTAVGRDFGAQDAAFAGLEAHVTTSDHTTLFTNTYPGGRRVQLIETESAPLRGRSYDLDDLGGRSYDLTWDAGFLAPVFGEVELASWLAALRPRARIVGIGCQGWLKRRGEPVPGRPGVFTVVPADWPPAPATLAGVDVACLSEEDVRGREALLERITAAVPLVAFTLGARGCLLLEGGRETHVPAAPATEVDPTGAGDTFAAALLYGLATGRDPVDAARLAATVAAVIVEARAGEAIARIRPVA